MDLQCLTRKRIWEVDCWSLDAAVAASFDWRELINLLQGHGHSFDLKKPETILELQAQCLIHDYSHSENEISLKIKNLLNEWYEKTMRVLSSMEPAQAAEYVLTLPFQTPKQYAGLFWALGVEPREGFQCIRRRFHQRFQIFSVRRLSAA